MIKIKAEVVAKRLPAQADGSAQAGRFCVFLRG